MQIDDVEKYSVMIMMASIAAILLRRMFVALWGEPDVLSPQQVRENAVREARLRCLGANALADHRERYGLRETATEPNEYRRLARRGLRRSGLIANIVRVRHLCGFLFDAFDETCEIDEDAATIDVVVGRIERPDGVVAGEGPQ
jgi:hypothetical protein